MPQGSENTVTDHIIDLMGSRPGSWTYVEISAELVKAGHISPSTGISPMLSGLVTSGHLVRTARGLYGLTVVMYVPSSLRAPAPSVPKTPTMCVADRIVDLMDSRRDVWSYGELHDRLIKGGHLTTRSNIGTPLSGLVAAGVLEKVNRGLYRLANKRAVERTYDRPVETDDVSATRSWPEDLTAVEREAFRLMIAKARNIGGVHRIVHLREQLAGVFGDEDLIDGFVAEAAARQMLACVSTEPHEIHRVDPARIQSML